MMRIEAGVEDQGTVEGHAADRVGASAGCYDGAFPEAVGDPSCHLLVGVHDEVGHPLVAEMGEETEIFYEEKADFGISGGPAIGDLWVMDYGADHADALTLDLHWLYDSCLPDFERPFAELFKMEQIVGAVFHSYFGLSGNNREYSGLIPFF